MGDQIAGMWDTIVEKVPTLLGGIAILVVGWIVAVIAATVVRGLCNRTSLDEKLGGFLSGGKGPNPFPVDRWLATGVKWLILLFTLMLFVDHLGLDAATGPLDSLLSKVTGFVPQLLAAGGLMFVGWLVATGVKMLVTRGLDIVGLDARLNKATDDDAADIAVGKSIGTAAYWVVLLLFMMMVLETLQLDGLLEPLQAMTTKVFAFLPNLLSAAVILVVGWFVATIVRRILTSVLAAVGVDRLADRTGISNVGKGNISGLLGTVGFLLILLPVISASLDALAIEAVSRPVSGLLATFFEAIPNLLYAAVIVGVAVVVGRLVAGLVTDLLARIGFDNVLQRLGLSSADASEIEESKRPSAVVGKLVLLTVLLFAGVEALDKLGLEQVSEIVHSFVELAGSWVFGLLIFGLGLWLANLVAGIIRDRGTPSSGLLAIAARVGITVLAGIAALDRMGLAEDVVKWTVIVTIASTGLAVGLSFGLGCREQAADQMSRWTKSMRDDSSDSDESSDA